MRLLVDLLVLMRPKGQGPQRLEVLGPLLGELLGRCLEAWLLERCCPALQVARRAPATRVVWCKPAHSGWPQR